MSGYDLIDVIRIIGVLFAILLFFKALFRFGDNIWTVYKHISISETDMVRHEIFWILWDFSHFLMGILPNAQMTG